MFSLQLMIWHGVRPLVQQSFQTLCRSTGLPEIWNSQPEDDKLKTDPSFNTPHTKNFHEDWLNKNYTLQEKVSTRNGGSWVKEIFGKVSTNEVFTYQGQSSRNYVSRTLSSLPTFIANIKLIFEFRLPGFLTYTRKDYSISQQYVAQENFEKTSQAPDPLTALLPIDDHYFIAKMRQHLPGIESETHTKEDIFQLIEAKSDDPFVLSMVKFREFFGLQWPPRASFHDWPDEWEPYREIAEEMSFKLRDFPSPDDFRVWMHTKCCKIDIVLVKQQLEEKWRGAPHSSAVYGLMGALAKLLFGYRWGKLPVTQEELDRKTLTFPPELMEVFEMISKHYGTIPRGSMFSTSFANVVYEKEGDRPQSVRFFFTTEEDMRHTEANFFNSFAHVDQKSGNALPDMTRYMALTRFAHNGGPEVAKLLLDQRVKCLENISHHVREMFKTFRDYINERKVKCKYWAPYIQAATAWNINGMTEGMSGAEIFGFNLLDTFLGVKGNSVVTQASVKKLQTIPEVSRELILSISNDDPDRFNSFLDLDLEDDPILKIKEEILGSLYTWRLGHAKVPARYFHKDIKTTSGGVVDNLGGDSSSLVEVTEKQLRKRAMETKASMAHKPRAYACS